MTFELQINFHGDLARFFLPPRLRGKSPIVRKMREKTAVKDVIEACGVPHPEVDLILVSSTQKNFLAIDFRWQVQDSVQIDVYGFPAPSGLVPSASRLQSRRCERFVADGHLGGLARNLRLLGLDTSYEPQADDKRLLEIMASEDRALLTRDRRLLMHSIVRHGFFPRSSHSEQQTTQVLRRFGLLDSPPALTPFSRCLECNGLLKNVEKKDISKQLAAEPRTLLYYNAFRLCSKCGRTFWPGSHFANLAQRVDRFVGS